MHSPLLEGRLRIWWQKEQAEPSSSTEDLVGAVACVEMEFSAQVMYLLVH